MHMLMLKKIKIFLASLIVMFSLAPAVVLAAPPPPDCSVPATLTTVQAIQCGTNNAAGVPVDANPGNSIDTTISNVVDLISVAVGIAAVIMLIVGGFRYVTSSGNQETVKAAKNTITYALIGLVIVALAQLIVNFVLNKTIQP